MRFKRARFSARARIALALAACLPGVSAQGAGLVDAYRLAQQNDPVFEAARYTLDAARQKIPEARAGLLPTLSLTGNSNDTQADSSFGSSPSVNRGIEAWTWTLQLTQPILRVSNLYAYRESQHIVEAAEAQYVQAEQDLILRVSRAYFDVVAAQEAIDAAQAESNAMGEQLEQATHGYRLGTHTITEVYEAKAKRASAMSQLASAKNDLEAKRADLEKMTGPLPPMLDALQGGVIIPKPSPDNVDSWIGAAKQNSPVVREKSAALAAAESEVGRNRADHLPTLDFNASYGKNYSSGSLSTPVDYSTMITSNQVGVQLTVPLFAGGATSAKVKEAVANQYKAQADEEAARRQAAADVRQAFAGIANGMGQIEALESAVDAGRESVKGTEAGYKLGIRMNIDVLNAQQEFYAAKRDLAKARYDTLFQGLKLKSAAGILSESDLSVIDAQLKAAALGNHGSIFANQ